jgi:hypothetical protein
VGSPHIAAQRSSSGGIFAEAAAWTEVPWSSSADPKSLDHVGERTRVAVSAFDRVREAYRAVVHGIDEKVLLLHSVARFVRQSPSSEEGLSYLSDGVASLMRWTFFRWRVLRRSSAYRVRRPGQLAERAGTPGFIRSSRRRGRGAFVEFARSNMFAETAVLLSVLPDRERDDDLQPATLYYRLTRY